MRAAGRCGSDLQVTYAPRTLGDPLVYFNSVHATVREADSRIPVTKMVTQAAEIDRTISPLDCRSMATDFAS